MTSYKGIFKYKILLVDYNNNSFPFINNNNSFKKLIKNEIITNTVIEINWSYEYVDNGSYDGLFLFNTIPNNINMCIIDFDKIPLSRKNRQFNYYKGSFPLDEKNLPTLLSNTDLTGCFDSSLFNGDITEWSLNNLKNSSLLNLFACSKYNNSSINNLNISYITQLNSMFLNNIVFNQSLNNWNTLFIGDIQYLFFGASSFNQDISMWNVSNVVNMSYSFYNASSFSQDLSTWNISNVIIMQNMLDYTNISIRNYDKLLLAWSALNVKKNVLFGVKNLKYSPSGKFGRDILVNKYKWIITGDILCNPPSNILLSNYTIDENKNIDSLIGTLITIDEDINETFNYTIDDTNNFRIKNNKILSNIIFNYELKKQYDVIITSTNSKGLYFSKKFTIDIMNINEKPTNIILSSDKIKFDEPIDTLIGLLIVEDEDEFENFTFIIDDKDNFKIVDNKLLSNVIFNDKTKTSYNINIRAIDSKNSYIEISFVIKIIYSGFFRISLKKCDLMLSNSLIINSGSFIKLERIDTVNNENIMVEYEYEFYDNLKTNDGLFLFNIISNNNMYIKNFGKIPLSRKNRQFQNYTGYYPNNSKNIPSLLPYTDITGCFDTCKFNGDITNWDLRNIKNNSLLNLFSRSSFNNDTINNLNVKSITQFNSMFLNNMIFNQPLNNWNTESMCDMQYIFYGATLFNQDIGMWNVSNVVNMSYSFYYASSFNQDISKWNVSKVETMKNMLDYCNMSIENYDKLLSSWSKLPKLQNDVIFGVQNLKYSINGKEGRNILINKYKWKLIGDLEC